MRRLVAVPAVASLGILFALISLACERQKAVGAAQEVQHLIDRNYLESLPYAKLAREVADHMPSVSAFIQRELAAGSGTRIDVVLQQHISHGDSTDQAETARFQARVYDALTKTEGVIAMEGHDCRPVTVPSMVRWTMDCTAMMGVTLTEQQAMLSVHDTKAVDGALRFALDHPDRRVIGYEDRRVVMLNSVVGQAADHGAVPPGSPIHQLAYKLLDLRSEIALARTIQDVREQHAPRGVIIIGAFHRQHLVDTAAKHGIAVRFLQI